MLKTLIGTTKTVRYTLESWLFQLSKQSQHLETLRDRYKGKPMLIVGNGPSLNKTPLERFKNVASIGMNKIDLLFGRTSWRPDMMLCNNNMVVIQHRDQFALSTIPIYLAWKSRWFIRRNSQSIHYFNALQTEAFQTDIPHRVGSGATVTYTALQFAYFMGADPVIIVGVDHNFDRSGDVNAYERSKGDDVNHFDPNYFGGGTLWGLPNLDASERVYAMSRQMFEADGRKIYDATIDGKLQIFEKISIEHAIKLTRSK